ncbi:MAG TPA: hypothetical protein VIV60_08125 [Polyangiaceae bacterium]
MSRAEPKSNRWYPFAGIARVRSLVVASAQASRTDTGEREDDEGAIVDPFFDSLVVPFTTEEPVADLDSDTDISAVDLVAPRDLEYQDDEKMDRGVSEVFAFSYAALEGPSDNTEGPLDAVDWAVLEGRGSIEESSDPEDGPVDKQPLLPEPIEVGDAQDNDAAEDGPAWSTHSELEIDDTELPWAKERWAELPLRVAFSPRQSLALVGSLLCVGGDATHLIGARHFEPIEDAPFAAKTRRVVCLDNDASRLLLLTTAGQLYLWNRSVEHQVRSIAVPGGEVVTSIWQLAPGVPVLLVRLDSGRHLLWNDANSTLDVGPACPRSGRLLAISDIGEPRISLWQHSNELELRGEAGHESHRLTMSESVRRAIAESHPLLAGFADSVLIGVRDYGLFLRKSNRLDFVKIPGCRRLTAMAVGQFQQRPTAFVGLFSELDDRADLVCVDLVSGRAARIAELSILTDDAGPTDDPPERARVDALSWDPTNLRLWAAGCFGLCCFAAPGTPTSS